MKLIKLIIFSLLFNLFFLSISNASVANKYIKLDFVDWEIVYNCDKKGYEIFHYTVGKDTGSLDRYSRFHHEKKLPKDCRQKSTGTYKSPKGSISFDRGHGVHQNIFDHSKSAMKKTNSMANIVPQASELNRRGVWRKTEMLTECWRDKGSVEVYGGVIWGDDKSNDYFLDSHGVTTPDYLWKLIIFPDGEVNAWVIPNNNEPKGYMVDDYLVSPQKISRLTGLDFPIERSQVNEKDNYSKPMPKYCSLK